MRPFSMRPFSRLLLATFALAAIANARTIALDAVVTALYGPNSWVQTVGWNFGTETDITIIALGAYWDGRSNFSAQVGLWTYDASQSLLASATVTTADTLIDGFYFRDITPVTLPAGHGYTIAAEEDAVGIGSGSGDPRIDWASSNSSPDLTFEYPSNVGFPGCAWIYCGNYGGDFLIADAGDLVPEPSTTLPLALCSACLLLFRQLQTAPSGQRRP